MKSVIKKHQTAGRLISIALTCSLCFVVFTLPAYGTAYQSDLAGQPVLSRYTDRLIIKLRNHSPVTNINSASSAQTKRLNVTEHLKAISTSAGLTGMTHLRGMSGGAQVIKLPGMLPVEQVRAIADRLAIDPEVEYVEPDLIMWPMVVPNDTYYNLQWSLHSSISEAGGINMPEAWDINTGIPSVTVAVIDTGVLSHADLAMHLLPGYDFVTDALSANDGDGRDDDPTDPGDWITADESSGIAAEGYFAGCPQGASSWHGTHIAGIIGAVSDNNSGITGVNWNSKILPVRVLGKCGGYSSDIIDGMRWAAGLAVSGAPANRNPADVLNLSFGAASSCTNAYQDAITDIVGAGKVIVVAAGNSAEDASNEVPANCDKVITVAANNRAGGLASYSNFGNVVDVSAPGGDYPLNPDGIPSTLDQGMTTALNDDTYSFYRGTSMAVPHVSAIASLMLSANYELTGTMIAPAIIEQKIKATARVFPAGTGTDCTLINCGAGIIDAHAALLSVTTPPVANAGIDQTVNANDIVTLDANGSSDDGSISGFSWHQVSGSDVNLSDSQTANPSLTVPAVPDVLTFEVTVSDDVGIQATDTVAITVNSQNEAPVANDGVISMFEGSTVIDDLAASDADGDILTYSIVANGNMGTAVITDANIGTFSYTPDPDRYGTDSFTFKVNDGSVDSNVATVTVSIEPINNSDIISSSTNSTDAGSGGGSMGSMTLLYGLTVLLWRRRRGHHIL